MIEPIIYNSDIEESSFTVDNITLLRYKNSLETVIQSHARNHFLHLKQEIVWKYPDAKMEFIQIDNGGKLKDGGRIRKWQEGSCSGFPDVMILLSFKDKQKTIFIEFKRIGTRSQILISDKQKEWNEKLKIMGFSVYITNNPLFFEKVICEEIKEFFINN